MPAAVRLNLFHTDRYANYAASVAIRHINIVTILRVVKSGLEGTLDLEDCFLEPIGAGKRLWTCQLELSCSSSE